MVVIAGTIGKSAVIDALVAAGKLDVAATEGKWEAFTEPGGGGPGAGDGAGAGDCGGATPGDHLWDL